MDDHEIKVVEAMEQYGGSFVKALANCFRHADRLNFTLLRQTFSEYWANYESMVRRG